MNDIITPTIFGNVKYDIVKYSIVFTISQLLLSSKYSPLYTTIQDPILFPNQTNVRLLYKIISVILLLIGFITFWIVAMKPLEHLHIHGNMKIILTDLLYFGFMLYVAQLLSGRNIDKYWLELSSYIIAGFIVYDVIIRKYIDQLIINKYSLVINDTLRYTTMFLLTNWLLDRQMNQHIIAEILATVSGLSFFNYFISHLI